MMKVSTKTAIIMSLFIASSLALTGCADQSDSMLVDNDGNKYQIIENEDGTKTAKYENGEHVTFRESEDGGLDFVDGSAILLGTMALSYMAMHYGSTPSGGYGYYDSGSKRFVASKEIRERREHNHATGGGFIVHSNSSSSGGKVDLSKSAAPSTPKVSSGFGGAGARGGGGSAVS